MHASQSHRQPRPSAAPTSTARPSRLLHWGQVVASGLAVCLLLSACGGDDNNGSDGKAREVRCAR